MPFCVFESIALAVASERLRTPAVAGHLVKWMIRLRRTHGSSIIEGNLLLEPARD